MLNIPTATEAAQQSAAREEAISETMARDVEKAIQRAIQRGHRLITLPNRPPELLRTWLTSKGYTVRDVQSGPNEYGTEVTW